MKNLQERLSGRLELADERIGKLEGRSTECIQLEEQRKKNEGK